MQVSPEGAGALAAAHARAEGLLARQRPAEVLPLLQPLLQQHPDDLGTLCTLGLAHAALQQCDAAVACFERAARAHPGNAPLLNNLGSALREAGRLHEALAVQQRAAALQPAHGVLQANLANTLVALGCVDEAIETYARHLGAHPQDAVMFFSDLLFAMNYSSRLSPQQVATAHRRYGELIEQPLVALRRPHANDASPSRPLRLGFVSSDLRQHPVAHFLEPLLAHLDPRAFDVHVYANSTHEDAVTARLKPHARAWRPVAQLGDDALAQRIRDDRIDMLVDLNGHTAGHRLPVFARRPAPVQLTWLGYPNTTGLQGMDWRITDAIADPPDTEAWYSERLWRLAPCFLCYRPSADAPEALPRRLRDPAARGAAAPVRFGSFNNSSKIGAPVVAAWAQVLTAVPGSVLVIKARGSEDPLARAALHRQFAAHGIEPARVQLVGRVERAADHLRRYHEVDVALDTFPYAGTTTTCDALWMGVPVVTLAGPVHASRVGASLLAQLGLQDLVADDVQGYVARAVALAADAPRRLQLRRDLRPRMAASALTDAAGHARGFEAALRGMWQSWCDTQRPGRV